MEAKKNLLTREGLKKYEDELHELKVIRRKEVAQKIKEAREQGDLSENAEYDAAKDEQRDIEARIEELEKILKNVEVVDMEDDSENLEKVSFGLAVKVKDNEFGDEMEFKIVGATEANSLKGKISNESPLGKALIGAKKGDIVSVEAPAGVIEYTILDIYKPEVYKKLHTEFRLYCGNCGIQIRNLSIDERSIGKSVTGTESNTEEPGTGC